MERILSGADIPAPSGIEELEHYAHYDLIRQETEAAFGHLSELCVAREQVLAAYLFGSAAWQALRTTEDDPSNPSDIDMLFIVTQEAQDILHGAFRQGAPMSAHFPYDSSTPFKVKRESASGKLRSIELFIFSDMCTYMTLNDRPRHRQNRQFLLTVLRTGRSVLPSPR